MVTLNLKEAFDMSLLWPDVLHARTSEGVTRTYAQQILYFPGFLS